MILVCPSCEAKFKVPDGAIPPDGRTVRCAKCKHSWRALPDQILARPAAVPAPARPVVPSPASPPPEMDAGMAARAAAVRRTVQDDPADYAPPPPVEDDIYDDDGDVRSAPEPSTKMDGDDFGVGAVLKANFGSEFDEDDDYAEDHEGGAGDNGDDDQYDEDDFLARRRAEQRRQAERQSAARKRKLLTALWGLLLVFWLVVLYLLVFKKEEVIYKMPGMAGFYEMFEGVSDVERFQPEEGEEVSTPLGEAEVYVSAALYNDRTKVEEIDGRNTLMVRGYIQNTSKTRSATVPQVSVEVLDGNKRVLTSWVTDPPGRILRRGAILNFETSLYPIPSGAANVAVKAIEGSRSAAEAQTP
ncbi:zinc-ribbon domain-containing protein [Kordiimonas sp.]|uniref:zinc-ribbon domain-containing protein n=1 Tax=Kordiimonas sp. TaxID=1970157 RepID=UPI003A95CC87